MIIFHLRRKTSRKVDKVETQRRVSGKVSQTFECDEKRTVRERFQFNDISLKKICKGYM